MFSDLEITEVVLVNCKFVNNDYQESSRVVYTFISNKSFGQLFNISLKNFIFLKTFNSEISYMKYSLLIKTLKQRDRKQN